MAPRTYTHALLVPWLWLAAASTVAAEGKYEPPEETDVFSPPTCKIDENGFFGTIGISTPLAFNYQMELKPSDPTATDEQILQSRLLAVSAVEDAISGFVLGTEVFDNLCTRRRRLQIQASIRGRRLNAVGVSSNPPDEFLPESDYPCDPPPTNGNDCVVVDAALTVFALATDPTLATDLKGQIETAMNDDRAFDDADATDTNTGNIESVTYVELTADNGNTDSSNGAANQVRSIGSSNNSNTAVIAGAAVGAAVVIGALVFYRRRHSKATEEAQFNSAAGGSSA